MPNYLKSSDTYVCQKTNLRQVMIRPNPGILVIEPLETQLGEM